MLLCSTHVHWYRRAKGNPKSGFRHGYLAAACSLESYRAHTVQQLVLSETGAFNGTCPRCAALHFVDEKVQQTCKKARRMSFTRCCHQGDLAPLPILPETPPLLHQLLSGIELTTRSQLRPCLQGKYKTLSQLHHHFLEHIRSYNCALSFCSYVDGRPQHAASCDQRAPSAGPPVYILHGRACHVVGTLTPPPGALPKFAQLYIYDPNEATRFRSSAFGDLHPPLLRCLLSMLTESIPIDPDLANPFESQAYAPRNPYPAHFANMYACILQNQRNAAETGCESKKHVLRFAGGVDKDPRTYAAPTSAEVSCAVVGEGPLPPHFISVYEKSDDLAKGTTHELSALSEHVDVDPPLG